MSIWYATREDIKSALDFKETARANKRIDRAIESASRSIEGLTRRVFYPNTVTKFFDYPGEGYARSWRVWFDSPDELVSASEVSSADGVLSTDEYFLEPVNDGPPYNRVEINLATSASFNSGGTFQRQVSVTGTWGYQYTTSLATGVSVDINDVFTYLNVDNSGAVGVGNLLLVDEELMTVVDRLMIDTSQTASVLSSSKNDNIISGLTPGSIFVDEILLIDAERMLVVDVAADTVIVERAFDGSNLSTHIAGSSIYASRRLQIIRGQQGTVATSHTATTPVSTIQYPGPVTELCIAEALNFLKQGESAYARTVGSGDNQREASGSGLSDLRNSVRMNYGRRSRVGSV